MKLDRRIFWLILAAGLPPLAVAGLACWHHPFGAAGWLVTAVLVAIWLTSAAALQAHVLKPLSTIYNLLAAFREGDYSVRGRIPGQKDILWQIMREANAFGEVLQKQRLEIVEARALLRRTLDEVDVAIFAFGPDRKLQLINRCGERYLGRDSEAVLGKPAGELGLAETLEGPCPRIFDSCEGVPGSRWELRRGLFRDGGVPCQVVLLADVTRALEEGERSAWESLIHVLRHEVNNSLAPISSIAASLIAMIQDEPRTHDLLEEVVQGLEIVRGRSVALHRFIQGYSQPTGPPPLHLTRGSVAEWVRRVLDLEQRLLVKLDPGPDLALTGDADQLDHLLINLVRNAVEAALDGGGNVSVGWKLESDWVRLWVVDDGPGLPDSGEPFMPYFTTKADGSGIGLAVSRRIAHAHGGQLTLLSRQDERGCRAELLLPLCRIGYPEEPGNGL